MPRRSTRGTNKLLMQSVLFVLLCVSCVEVNASSLFGKVIEVRSGDVITVFNLNRPVRVRLLGVDAPEMEQAFGEVAKKHLADLVLDKSVIVEYFGISGDGSLTGRVLLNNADVGAQMIRDGVAWFDPNNQNRLSATDREVYQQSEQAARSERRGLWQADDPTAPWEFVRIESLKRNPVRRLNSNRAARRGDGSVPELTNLTLLAKGANGPARHAWTRNEIQEAWHSLTASNKKFHEMRPPGENFSAFVPDEGRQISLPIGDSLLDVNMYIARDGASLYAVMWVTGPTDGEADRAVIDTWVLNFIKASHERYAYADRGHFFCGKQREKDVSMDGYTGWEFDLSSCSLPTRARAFTRVVDNQREMYVGIVFFGDNDANVGRFIKSFTVGPPGKAKTRSQ